MKSIQTAIEEEKKLTDSIITQILNEHRVVREKFDSAIEMYKNDHEVLNVLNKSVFEPNTGESVEEAKVIRVLKYEAENILEGTPAQKCLIEDDVKEMFEVEIGDVHKYAKAHKINIAKIRLR